MPVLPTIHDQSFHRFLVKKTTKPVEGERWRNGQQTKEELPSLFHPGELAQAEVPGGVL